MCYKNSSPISADRTRKSWHTLRIKRGIGTSIQHITARQTPQTLPTRLLIPIEKILPGPEDRAQSIYLTGDNDLYFLTGLLVNMTLRTPLVLKLRITFFPKSQIPEPESGGVLLVWILQVIRDGERGFCRHHVADLRAQMANQVGK